jgi:hypothetical protein
MGDSELLDLINLPACNQVESEQPNIYELDENGDQSISELIIDASCRKNLVFVARRSRDAFSTIPILFGSSKIEQAVFVQCRINDDDVLKISKAVASGCAMLKSLVMQKNLISCTGARHLATGMHIHGCIQHVDLSFNRCGDKGAEYLAFLVLKSKVLHVLRLRGNGIQSRGAIALANALIQNHVSSERTLPNSLEILDLACNEIGDSGAEAFSVVLRLNRTLRTLDMSHNSITIAGARRLSSALEENQTLNNLLVRAVTRSSWEQAELTALQLRHTCGPASKRCVPHKCSLYQ